MPMATCGYVIPIPTTRHLTAAKPRLRFTAATAMTACLLLGKLPHLVGGPAILNLHTDGSWHRICATPSLFRLRPYGHNTSPRD